MSKIAPLEVEDDEESHMRGSSYLAEVNASKKPNLDLHSRLNQEDECGRGKTDLTRGRDDNVGCSPNVKGTLPSTGMQQSRLHQSRSLQPALARRAIIGLILFFSCGFASIILPWFIVRQVFDLPLLCFDENEPDSVDPKCENEALKWRQGSFLTLFFLNSTFFYSAAIYICGDPFSPNLRRYTRWQFWLTIIIIPCAFGPPSLHLMISASMGSLGFLVVIFFVKRRNRGMFRLTLSYILQYTITMFLIDSFGERLHDEFIFGINYSVLIPFYVQAMQGISIYICQKTSPICEITEHNRDWIIFGVKYQMAFLSTLKMTGLLSLIRGGDVATSFVVNIFLDAIGRNQVMRLIYRHIRSKVTGEPISRKKLSFLAQVSLSSEMDMDYLSLVIFIFVNIANSPFAPTIATRLHISDSYLTLHDDSLLHQSFTDVFILILTVILGDFATYGLGRVLGKNRVYDLEFTFCESRVVSVFGGCAVTCAIANVLFSTAHLLFPVY